jgi:RimJ/RimL family protein N-acetyltransferase
MDPLSPAARIPVPVTLSGRHVRLEPLTPAHLPDLFAAGGGDEEVWRWLPVPTPRTPDELRALLDKLLADCAAGTRVAFAVVHLATGRAVGWTTYGFFSARDERLEIGWTWYGRAVWRTAVNTESKLLLLTHAFEELGMGRVSWRTDHLNTRSQQAIIRLGAVREGVFRRETRRPDGSWRDNVHYAMLKDDWPAAKRRLAARLATDRGLDRGGVPDSPQAPGCACPGGEGHLALGQGRGVVADLDQGLGHLQGLAVPQLLGVPDRPQRRLDGQRRLGGDRPGDA